MKLADKISFELIKWARGSGHEILIPNFYHGWYEMDLFRLTNTEYVIEYEIKISRGDFLADLKKHKTVHDYSKLNLQGGRYYPSEKVLKHDMLKKGEGKCNRFFFVVPENLIRLDEVPSHCGLIYYRDGHLRIVKNAPMLHKRHTADFKKLAVSLSFREVNQRIKLQGFISKSKS